MAIVMGAILVVGWLALVYISNQAYASRVTPPLQIIPVFGGGGGSPDGTPGSTEKIDVPSGDTAATASNNEEAAGDFEEPAVQETPSGMLDAVAEAGQSLAEVDLGAVMPSGGPVASGKRPPSSARAGPGSASAPATAASPMRSAGASSTRKASRPTTTPASSTPWESSSPSSPGPTSSSTSPTSRARRRPSGRVPTVPSTGCTFSGRAGAARRTTSSC